MSQKYCSPIDTSLENVLFVILIRNEEKIIVAVIQDIISPIIHS